MKIKQYLVNLLGSIVARFFRREIILMPLGWKGALFDSRKNGTLIPVRYSYRATSDGWVRYEFFDSAEGLRYDLYAMIYLDGKPVRGQLCLSLKINRVSSGDALRVNLQDRIAILNNEPLPCEEVGAAQARKFIAQLQYAQGQERCSRVCSHYLPFEAKQIGRDYYFGDDYIDYPSSANVPYALTLVQTYRNSGRLLDVGCALGVYTSAFLEAGFDAFGIDISEYAVEEAIKQVGSERARVCNLDQSAVPFEQPFDIFWMWDVLEHSTDPKAMLEKVTQKARDGSHLILHTSNSSSLTRMLYGADWEGFSDYSHYGADKITAVNLREWLSVLGWEILLWKCERIWTNEIDPTHLRLAEAFSKIPELATLFKERELGDLILVVAQKRHESA